MDLSDNTVESMGIRNGGNIMKILRNLMSGFD